MESQLPSGLGAPQARRCRLRLSPVHRGSDDPSGAGRHREERSNKHRAQTWQPSTWSRSPSVASLGRAPSTRASGDIYFEGMAATVLLKVGLRGKTPN